MSDLDDVIKAIRGCKLPPRSGPGSTRQSLAFQAHVATELERAGWSVRRFVAVSYRGRPSSIDVVAERGASVVAIEFDNAAPRARSLAKLRRYERATLRVVALRVGHAVRLPVPKGIDCVAAVDPPRVVVSIPRPVFGGVRVPGVKVGA